jgi:hypothetical protein
MRRGEVVELDWQFSDLTGSKRRPAVVVQADFLNGLIGRYDPRQNHRSSMLRNPRDRGGNRSVDGNTIRSQQDLLRFLQRHPDAGRNPHSSDNWGPVNARSVFEKRSSFRTNGPVRATHLELHDPGPLPQSPFWHFQSPPGTVHTLREHQPSS